MRPGATTASTPATTTASCPFCARERQVCSTAETPFLVGETFSEHGTRDLTWIARCSLGYRAHLVQAGRDGTNHALRTVNETGFGEIPGVGHQGGSSLAVSRNSKNPDAAWIFMQWATCYDTQVLITALGGGTGPTRESVYDDPRIIANRRVGAGTTRHLDVVRETIAKDMGSEPDLPQWAELSNDTIPVRLGKYFAGEYGSAKEAMDDIAQAVDKIVQG